MRVLANMNPVITWLVTTVLNLNAGKNVKSSQKQKFYERSQQTLAPTVVCFGFLSPNFPTFWSGSFLTAPSDLLGGLMYPGTQTEYSPSKTWSTQNKSFSLENKFYWNENKTLGMLLAYVSRDSTDFWKMTKLSLNRLPSRSLCIPLQSHERRSIRNHLASWNSQSSALK